MLDSQSASLQFYRPSGAAPLSGVVLSLFLGVIAGAVIGIVYALINHYLPSVNLGVVLTPLFGIAVGIAVSKLVKKFQIRSVTAALVIAVVTFIVAYFFHWIMFLTLLISQSFAANGQSISVVWLFSGFCQIFITAFSEPGVLIGIARKFMEIGYSVSGRINSSSWSLQGNFLGLMWLLEAVVSFACTLLFSLTDVKKPFSETRMEWIVPRPVTRQVAYVADAASLKAQLARGDFQALTTPVQLSSQDNVDSISFANVTLYEDQLESYVSVENVMQTLKRKKKNIEVKEKKRDVLKYLRISNDTSARIASALNG